MRASDSKFNVAMKAGSSLPTCTTHTYSQPAHTLTDYTFPTSASAFLNFPLQAAAFRNSRVQGSGGATGGKNFAGGKDEEKFGRQWGNTLVSNIEKETGGGKIS